MSVVRVDLAGRAYEVRIGQGLLADPVLGDTLWTSVGPDTTSADSRSPGEVTVAVWSRFTSSTSASPAPVARERVSWAVAISDDYDDAQPRVVLTVEEVGRAGEGLVTHLSPVLARRLRAALRDALREIGEPPGD